MTPKLKLDLKGRNPDDGMNSIAYDKGYLFLRTIEEKVGREKMDAFLKAYFKKNAFSTTNTEDFNELSTTLIYWKRTTFLFNTKEWIYQTRCSRKCCYHSIGCFYKGRKHFASIY